MVTTLPASIAKFLQLSVGQRIEWDIKDGDVLIRAVRERPRKKLKLDDLLDEYESADLPKTNEDQAWLNSPAIGKELI